MAIKWLYKNMQTFKKYLMKKACDIYHVGPYKNFNKMSTFELHILCISVPKYFQSVSDEYSTNVVKT